MLVLRKGGIMEILHEYHNIRTFNGVYTPDECQKIINVYNSGQVKKADTTDQKIRPTQYADITEENWSPIYLDFLKPKIQNLIHRFNSLNYPNVTYRLKWKCLDLALIHYPPGSFCKCHFDGAQIKMRDDGVQMSAHATMIIFLTQGEDGLDGALMFPSYGYHVSCELGNATIFPTSYTHPHEVKPVKSERYVIAGWLFIA
jgi:predicted 2-oxoglutarate/Fe(II)-dependent dioxygenase YbiX